VQELLGGKFGEMSTLMNYTYQSFNMRGKSKIRPYYDLVANIAAEELGHIELVANTVNLLQDQTEASGEVPDLEPAALRPDRERRGYRGDRQEAVSRGEAGAARRPPPRPREADGEVHVAAWRSAACACNGGVRCTVTDIRGRPQTRACPRYVQATVS
jgi:hypothetical protein